MQSSAFFFITIAFALPVAAQQPGANYDEAKVPAYTLPDPLTLQSGGKVKDAQTWETRRRPEIVALLESEMFGRSPSAPAKISSEIVSVDSPALDGKAIRAEYSLDVAGRKIGVLFYRPANGPPRVPVFLVLNFTGNHAISPDPGIHLPNVWSLGPDRKPVARLATDQSRGSAASRYPVEMILARGYGLVTAYYGDIEPDLNGALSNSVRAAYLKPGHTAPAPDEWGAIAAWAWGLSRIVDYLVTNPHVDPGRIALMGHSRLGKTALWAGAMDKRFALVISNDSGEGGAAISRRKYGETVRNLNTTFPHWYCDNYKKYSDHEENLPFDSHMLLALIAPRPLYVASAIEDQWADPKGEFLGAAAASPVYELFGKTGIPARTAMPGVHQPVGASVRYHVRAGKHDVTDYDWQQYLDFADQNLPRPRK